MIGKISRITNEGLRTYRVSLATLENEPIGDFLFEIAEGDIEAVTWDANFEAYMGVHPQPIRELFKAIFAVHHAQRLELPPRE